MWRGRDRTARGRRASGLRSVDLRHAAVLLRGQADPDVERERFREDFPPIFAQRLAGNAADEFVEEEAEGAGVIPVCGARWPERLLAGERVDHGAIIENVHAVIETSKARLVREQLRQSDRLFLGLSELGPELRHGGVESDLVFLQDVQEARASKSFRGRPDEDEGISGPGLLALGIAEAAV